MSTDRWGIDDGYFDAHHQWKPTSTQTRAAILQAMGVEDPNAPAPDGDDVRFLEAGRASAWPEPGHLQLEDGAQLAVNGHLPADMPLGYHDFFPATSERRVRLIVAPPQCPLPPQPIWGWSVQLYSARSAASWGIGDLGDLRRLAAWSHGLGAGLMMVNPLVAPTPTVPQEPSPYFPSSRRFRNPLYLDIADVPGAATLGPVGERLAAAGRALNAQPLIDRDAIWQLKQEALRQLWGRFSGDPDFDAFCRQRGAELTEFATHCALSELHGPDWRKWPDAYRHPQQPAVQRFAQEQARQVNYHKWCQWLLDRQLAAASREVALVHDLPIGFNPAGADGWAWQSLLATGCTVGAPPDIFNTIGQDWGLPPFIPHRWRGVGYEPFIQTIRASLRHAGGLRIDHVMGLFRLYWIPGGFGPARGTYVRYNARELMSIVALESHRAGAFVVGEDLGTVEMGVREQLAQRNLLSFRLLWFEEQPPRHYPQAAMAAATTHDLPTVAGLWSDRDRQAQTALGFDTQALVELRQRFGRLSGISDQAPLEDVVHGAYQLLGEAPSLLLVATLEDALAVTERPNMPGTVIEWPNWRRALPGGLEALQQSPLPRRIAQALQRRKA